MILLGLLLLCWCFGYAILFRVPRCPAAVSPPEVALSVVIPARNEAARLPRLLDSLKTQSLSPHEILVVDDDSSDDTAALARAGGARVVASSPLPDGWRGKTWACHQGAQEATGAYLLFLDADTLMASDALARLVAAHRGGEALSVAPWHEVPRPYEQLSAFFTLMMAAGVGAFSVLGERLSSHGLFGQVLLVDRASYNAAGGHAAVKQHILENMAMSSHFQEVGVPVRCLGGLGSMSVRMYPSGLGELVAGWRKAFAQGAARVPVLVLLMSVGWMTGLIVSGAGLVSAMVCRPLVFSSAVWVCVYLLFALQCLHQLRRLGGYRAATALLYPVPLLFYLIVFTLSVWSAVFHRPVTWRGRVVTDRASP